ncbi:hypothetical protein RJ035_008307 [Blastomyces gilchristii]
MSFIQVDEEALWSVVEGDPDDTLDGSWVHLVRAGDHDFDRSAKAEEDEDDGEVEDEGWMMIAAYTIGPDFYDLRDSLQTIFSTVLNARNLDFDVCQSAELAPQISTRLLTQIRGTLLLWPRR